MAQFNYLQVKHTTTGDVLGQMLTYDSVDAYLLEYHTQMKNAINNPEVLGMDIKVLDGQLNEVFRDKWIREISEPAPEPEPEPVEGE